VQDRAEAGRRRNKEEGIKRKREKGKREKEREMAEIATRRACAPVGRDARNEGEQGDGTAIGFGCRDRDLMERVPGDLGSSTTNQNFEMISSNFFR
jgi:hypothetical protein